MGGFTHILVPTDFSEPSRCALDVAVDFAKRYGAKLTLVHTCEVPSYAYAGTAFSVADLLSPVTEAAREQLEAALRDLRVVHPESDAILRVGEPADEILTAIAESKADLVVMGTHGREGLSHAWFGSVAERTVRTSPVPVVTVRGKK